MGKRPPAGPTGHAEVARLPRDPFIARVEASRRQAARLWRELSRLPYERQEAALFSDPRYSTWGLAELLAQRSIEAASRDPQAALNLAYLASNVPFGMRDDPPAWASEARIEQLLAYTVAHVANGLRVAGFLPRADHIFQRAFDCWSLGADEPDTFGYRARILNLQASLLRAQRRVPEALTLLHEVVDYYLSIDPHLAGRALVQTAKALEEVDCFEEALGVLGRAANLIDPPRDPTLVRTLRHNTAWCLATVGRTLEARSLFPELHRAYRDDPESLDALRVGWLEARILRGEGYPARSCLERVRRGFQVRGLKYEQAVASLELALLAAEAGDAEEVESLVGEVVPVLQSQKVLRLFRERGQLSGLWPYAT